MASPIPAPGAPDRTPTPYTPTAPSWWKIAFATGCVYTPMNARCRGPRSWRERSRARPRGRCRRLFHVHHRHPAGVVGDGDTQLGRGRRAPFERDRPRAPASRRAVRLVSSRAASSSGNRPRRPRGRDRARALLLRRRRRRRGRVGGHRRDESAALRVVGEVREPHDVPSTVESPNTTTAVASPVGSTSTAVRNGQISMVFATAKCAAAELPGRPL